MAQEAGQNKNRWDQGAHQDRDRVFDVPRKVYRIFVQAWKVLLRKLQTKSGSSRSDSVELRSRDYVKTIEPFGRSPVYCMEVEGSHALSVSGGLIAHNCMDLIRYFSVTTNYSIIEEVDPSLRYQETDESSRKRETTADVFASEMLKKDLSLAASDDYYDDDPSGGIWN